MPCCRVQPETLPVIEPNRQPAGRGRQRWILGCFGTFADLSRGLVLVKASFGEQLVPSHMHLSSAEAAINCGLLTAPDTLLRANHKQRDIGQHHSPSQEAQNQHTQCPATEQDSISLASSISKGSLWQAPSPAEANSAPCGQQMHSSSHRVSRFEPHS